MKKLRFCNKYAALVVLLILGFVSEAQQLQVNQSFGFDYRNIKIRNTLIIPSGTTPVFTGGNTDSTGSLFFRTTDTALYAHNGTTWVKMGGTGGVGGTYTAGYGIVLGGGAFRVDTGAGKIATQFYVTNGFYTKTQINSFFGGTTFMPGYNKANWDAAFSWGNHAGLYPTTSRFLDSIAAIRAIAGGGGGGGTGDMTKAIYDTDNDGVVDNSELLSGQNTAYYLSRANHTGTQAQSTITNLVSDLAAKQAALNGVGFIKANGTTISYDNTAYTPTTRTINGQALTSNVVLTTGNIAEGSNLYYTDTRVQAVIDANTFSFRNSQYSNGITLLHSLGASSALFKKLYFTGGGVTVTPVGDSAYIVDILSGNGTGGDMYLAGVQTVTGQKTFTAETYFQGNIQLGATSDGIITVPTGEGLKVSNGSINSSIIKPFGIHTYFQNIEGAGNFYYTGPSGTTSTGRVIYNTAGVDIDGTLKLGSVANDNTETNILVWNSTDKVLEYRTVASLPSGGSHVHNASTDITTGTLPIARGGTGLSTIGTAGQSIRVAAGGTALEYYTPSGGGSGTDSAFTRMVSINDSTVRFYRFNGTYQDLVRPCDTGGTGTAFTETTQEYTGSTSSAKTLSQTPIAGSVQADVNGVIYRSSNVAIAGNIVTLSGLALSTTDIVTIRYRY